jgi:hypothetical protein
MACRNKDELVVDAAAKLDRDSLLELVGVQSKLINALREENLRLGPEIDRLNKQMAKFNSKPPEQPPTTDPATPSPKVGSDLR